MTSRRLYRILLPAVTFLGGVFIQLLLERWVSLGIVTTLSLVMVLISLAILFTASLHILESIESKFSIVDKNLNSKFDLVNEKLMDLFSRTGLTVNCIEDGEDKISYIRAAELINNAKSSLTAVTTWSPFQELRPNAATKEYVNYYDTIERKITEFQKNKGVFHRRIIQVPEKYVDAPLEFAKETPFINCLKHTIMIQALYPRSCQIRKSPTLLNIHFTIVDRRYIIMPIFNFNEKTKGIVRHGALIYGDIQKDFVNYLESIYNILDSYSRPITPDSLTLINYISNNTI